MAEAPHQFAVNKTFLGVNLLVPRESIGDGEHAWLENWQPVGTALLSVPGPETPVLPTIAGRTPARLWSASINNINYLVVWVQDGELWVYNLDTGTAPVKISGANNITNPDVSQFKSERILIADATTGYCDWDGTTFTVITSTKYTKVATYSGRVWLANIASAGPRTYVATSPNTYNDFNPKNGAIAVILTEAELRLQILQLVANSDFLYIFGDNAVFYIANVQADGTHQRNPVDLTSGAASYGSAASFEKTVMFAGADGIHIINGLVMTPVSNSINPLFVNFFSSTAGMTASLATINGILSPVFRTTYNDPIKGARILYVIFQEDAIYFSSQGKEKWTTTVQTNGIASTYATDGISVYRLFQNVDASIPRLAISKRYELTGNPVQNKSYVRAGLALNINSAIGDFTLTLDSERGKDSPIDLLQIGRLPLLTWVTNNGQPIVFTTNNGGAINWFIPGLVIASGPAELSGNYVGITLEATNPNNTIISSTVEYVPGSFWL